MKSSAATFAVAPPAVLTLRLTGPAVPAGETAVICVGDTTVNEAASTAPNLTAVAPVRLVPLMVTVVPPATGPRAGATEATVGDGIGGAVVVVVGGTVVVVVGAMVVVVGRTVVGATVVVVVVVAAGSPQSMPFSLQFVGATPGPAAK